MTQDPNYDPNADPRHPGGFEPYQNTNYGNQTMPAPKNSVAALVALITGAVSLIPCLGLLTAPVALISGVIGFFTAGKPSVKGRWMAVLGLLLALVGGGYQVATGVFLGGKAVEVARAVEGFSTALNEGDFSAVQPYTDMTQAEFTAFRAEFAEIGDIQNVDVRQTGEQSAQGSTSFQVFEATIEGANGTKTIEFTIELPVFGGDGVKIIDVNVK
ncbi:MAG: hypothetical protein AAF743_12180 [Planctomycetota bacterium]